MSYILDALRRADAERERGAVPSLHAQQYELQGSDDDEPRRFAGGLPWLVAGVAVLLLAAGAWFLFGREAARPLSAAASPLASGAASGATPMATAPATVAAVAPASAVATAAAPAASAAATPARAARKPLPPRRTDTDAAGFAAANPRDRAAPQAGTRRDFDDLDRGRGPNASARVDGGGPARSDGSANAPRRNDPGATDGRIVNVRELPDDVRKALPNVSVSGSTYSTDKASRMLMINGQIFREGDAIAAGLVLQQIRPRGAVFGFRGYRYEIGF